MAQENITKKTEKSPTATVKTPTGRKTPERSSVVKTTDDKEFDSKLLDLARVTRVSAAGKHFRFRALMIIGDKNGRVGMGVAKGSDVAQAIQKATRLAKKNLIEVPIVHGTILHEVFAKFGAAKILLKPQRKGRGLVAGGTVRVICDLVGIKNISSKILGSTTNRINNARATIKALKELKMTSDKQRAIKGTKKE